jgi:hypothetical protein
MSKCARPLCSWSLGWGWVFEPSTLAKQNPRAPGPCRQALAASSILILLSDPVSNQNLTCCVLFGKSLTLVQNCT